MSLACRWVILVHSSGGVSFTKLRYTVVVVLLNIYGHVRTVT